MWAADGSQGMKKGLEIAKHVGVKEENKGPVEYAKGMLSHERQTPITIMIRTPITIMIRTVA